MSNIDATLAERGSRYGEFPDHAEITQSLKDTMRDGANWDNMDDDQKEALEMVAHKIGRIVNGDPDYIDSWTDIIGYTRLVEKRLIAEQTTAKAMMAGDSTRATTFGPLPPCDDPSCPACHPSNHASVSQVLASFLKAHETEPKSADVVSAALNTLLAAGVIKPA